MASTPTTRHAFSNPAFRDKNWHIDWQNNFNKLDSRLPWNYNGNPNTNVAGDYIGQQVYDYANRRLYICTTTGVAAAAVWTEFGAIPSGLISMWSGTIATIPAGWVLCNGSNGTPDLRDKFIVGARQDDDSVAKTNITGSLLRTGGASSVTSGAGGDHAHGASTGSHTLTTAEIPAHAHAAGTLSTDSAGAHTHQLPFVLRAALGPGGSFEVTTSSSTYTGATASGGAHTHAITGSTANAGSGGGHSHSISASGTHTHSVSTIPVFYALAFIMKV